MSEESTADWIGKQVGMTAAESNMAKLGKTFDRCWTQTSPKIWSLETM